MWAFASAPVHALPLTWKEGPPVWVDQWALTSEKLAAAEALIKELLHQNHMQLFTLHQYLMDKAPQSLTLECSLDSLQAVPCRKPIAKFSWRISLLGKVNSPVYKFCSAASSSTLTPLKLSFVSVIQSSTMGRSLLCSVLSFAWAFCWLVLNGTHRAYRLLPSLLAAYLFPTKTANPFHLLSVALYLVANMLRISPGILLEYLFLHQPRTLLQALQAVPPCAQKYCLPQGTLHLKIKSCNPAWYLPACIFNDNPLLLNLLSGGLSLLLRKEPLFPTPVCVLNSHSSFKTHAGLTLREIRYSLFIASRDFQLWLLATR